MNSTVVELISAVERLEITVDADELSALLLLRETLLAKAMAPLRAFDELQLYQLSKARSSQQFLQRAAGLSSIDAGLSVTMARKVRSMPLTEAAWLAGTLPSGHVRAIVANVGARVAERYSADESDVLRLSRL